MTLYMAATVTTSSSAGVAMTTWRVKAIMTPIVSTPASAKTLLPITAGSITQLTILSSLALAFQLRI